MIIQRMFRNNSFNEYVQKFLTGRVDEDGNCYSDTIDTQTALKYAAVFACNRVLSETLASMPAMEYRKKAGGDREQTNDTGVYDILHNAPNEEMSPFNFKEACMSAINLGGNSVSQKLVNNRGELVGLYPYEWQRVSIRRNTESQKLIYVVDGKMDKPFKRSEVFHIAGPSLNGVVGLTPINYVASAIKLGLSYEQFGNNLYKNSANASGAFKHPSALDEQAFYRLKKELKENYTGLRNTGTPMLLEDGLEFQPFTINPADAQLIENKRFQTEDVCRIYRVPLHLVQDLSRSTNNNIEMQSLEFVIYTMIPHFKRWEENINMQLLTPDQRKAGYYIEFKIDSLLRGDIKSRCEAYAAGRQWGWMSANDIRKLENMSPIENGNIYLTPSNMYEAGKEPTMQQQQDKTKALAEEIFKMIQEKG